MLASVYSYHVMVKSISSCCVHGRWVLSNPVTIMVLCMCSLVRSPYSYEINNNTNGFNDLQYTVPGFQMVNSDLCIVGIDSYILIKL